MKLERNFEMRACSIFTFVVAVLLGISQFTEYLKVSEEFPAVSLFFKAYTLLWVSVIIWIQDSNKKILIQAIQFATTSNTK